MEQSSSHVSAYAKISGSVLWLNAHLLFWVSLIPFVTAWMGENHFAAIPTTFYGIILLMSGIAYYFLAHALQDLHGQDSVFSKALNKDRKGKLSIVLYAVGIPFSLLHPMIAFSVYVVVTLMWFVLDRRFEKLT